MRALTLPVTLLVCLSLASLASAQDCAKLSVTGDGAPGTALTFEMTGGARHSLVFLVIGKTAGDTALEFGRLGTLNLGLAKPFAPLALGFSDANGDITRAITVPERDVPSLDLLGQGLTVNLVLEIPMGGRLRIGLDFCTSGVEGFHIGK